MASGIIPNEIPNYKIIIIGDSGVGKTTLFHRILFGTYVDTSVRNKSTIGLDCFEKTVKVLGQCVRIDLQDCQGRERFRTRNISNLYHRADAVLLTYSVADPDTFESLPFWIEECKDNIWGTSGRDIVWAVVGNKSDLYSEVSPERVEDTCDTLETNLSFEISARTGNNVENSFVKIVEVLHEKKLRLSRGKASSFLLNKIPENSSKKSCCTTQQ